MTVGNKMTGLCLVAGAAVLGVSAQAQDAPPQINNGAFTWSLGADAVSTYIFRGYEQEDSGLIIQPYVEVGTPLGDSGLDLVVGQWNSLHSKQTGESGNGPGAWYESDFYAGVTYAMDQFTFGGMFTGYYSPNNAFRDIEELAFTVAYDDSDYLGEWAVTPYAMLAIETRDAGGSEDIYLELGGELGAPFVAQENMGDISLSFPFAIGLSIDDYYQDAGGDNEFWGFLAVGAAASMPLNFLPAEYGSWGASAGLDLVVVNDDANLLDNGDDFALVLSVGIGMEY